MANKVKKFDVAKALNLASRFGVEEEVLEELIYKDKKKYANTNFKKSPKE